MSMTLIAMIGILLGFLFLAVGFFMEGPDVELDPPLINRHSHKRSKKRVGRLIAHRHHA